MSLVQLMRRGGADVAYAVVLVAGAVAATGCATACDTYANVALRVTITDSRTGEPASAGATIIVAAREFRDSLTFASTSSTNSQYYHVNEPKAKAGFYMIEIRKPGYDLWRRLVVVDEDDCHVITNSVRAELVPAE